MCCSLFLFRCSKQGLHNVADRGGNNEVVNSQGGELRWHKSYHIITEETSESRVKIYEVQGIC